MTTTQHAVTFRLLAGKAAAHFDEAELAQLLWAIAAINAWNRIGLATHLAPRS